MHFVLTNDDGYRAEGLAALYRAVGPQGTVTIVAPRQEQSSRGHAITTDRSLSVERVELAGLGRVYVCEGTSADCVRLAVTELARQRVDWVLAGINHGANVGVDHYYSGTVAAAREAAILGCKAAAVSQYFMDGIKADWGTSSRRAAEALERLFRYPEPCPALWSVTLPVVTAVDPQVRLVAQELAPLPMKYERTGHSQGMINEYRYHGRYRDRDAAPDRDVATVFGGDIAVTPLLLDATDYGVLANEQPGRAR